MTTRYWWCPQHRIRFTMRCECCHHAGGATPEYVALGVPVWEINWGDARSHDAVRAKGGS